MANGSPATGQLAVRQVGLADLVEQLFFNLKPNTAYILALSNSDSVPYNADYEINSFVTESNGKYAGQSTGLVKSTTGSQKPYKHVILIEKATGDVVMTGENR